MISNMSAMSGRARTLANGLRVVERKFYFHAPMAGGQGVARYELRVRTSANMSRYVSMMRGQV